MKLMLLCAVLCLSTDIASAQAWKLLIPVRTVTMVVNPKDANKLYIGHEHNQIYTSTDAGKSWERVVVGSLFGSNSVTSMAISATDTSVMLIGGYAFQGIKRTTNSGVDWIQSLIDPDNLRMWFISDAIVRHPSQGNKFYAARGTFPVNIYQSNNNGASWDSISNIGATITSRICTITIRPDSTNILYLGVLGGRILRSDDSGRSWKLVPVLRGADSINPGSEIPKIVFDHKNPQNGYAIVAISTEAQIADNGGILKTTNGGHSWDRIALADTSFWAIDLWNRKDGVTEIFAGGFRTSDLDQVVKGDSLIFRSTDEGASWHRMLGTPWQKNSTGDTLRNIWMIRHDSVGHRMYMGTEVGLYVLDEATGVSEEEFFSNDFRVVYHPSEILIMADKPRPEDIHWKLYSMSAQMVASGDIQAGRPVSLATSELAVGRYLLLWGSDKQFRTLLLSVQR